MIVNKKIQELVRKYHENKLSHAFLFVTNDLKRCNSDIKELIKQICCEEKYSEDCTKCNLCHLIDHNSIPNIVEIYPDGALIKKNQILELKEAFKAKPLYIKNNIYIINSAEKLNSSSANTMLKFLEEPEENIIGFFITTNKENLLDTIKSRCQIINVNYNYINMLDMLNVDSEKFNLIESTACEYLYSIFIKNESGIYLNRKIFVNELKERDFINTFFLYLFYTFNKIIVGEIEEKYIFFKDFSTKKLKFINKSIYKTLETIPFNVNIDLMLDEFAIELEKIR